MSEKINVPRLRFKEFDSSWTTELLGKVAEIIDCKHRTPPYVERGIPVISPGTIKWGNLDLESPTKRVSESEHQSLMDHCNPKIGDFVLSRNQSVGVASIVTNNEKFVLGQDTVLVQPHKVDPFFAYYRIQTNQTQTKIQKQSGGSTFSRINLSEIRKLKIKVSSVLEEQQKIAEFLTTVDQRIELLQAKKEKLEAYKKGVMQKIFSQQLRFKADDGSEFPNWEERKLGEICKKQSSNVTAGSLEEISGSFKIYGATGFLQYVDFYQVESEFISIVKDGAGVGRVLKCEPKSSVLGTLDMIIPKNGVDIDFLFAALDQINFLKYMTGSTIPHIYFKDYAKERIMVPSLPEQQKIAQFLTSLDSSIENLNQQINHTQTWKKGLLQKMFV